MLPNSRVLIHQPWVRGLGGQQSDVQIPRRRPAEIARQARRGAGVPHRKDPEQVHRDTERDNILTAEEAIEYGLADRVMVRRQVPKEKS